MKQGKAYFQYKRFQRWFRRHFCENKVHQAYAEFAERTARAARENMMATYYQERALEIDPHTHWWAYAAMRQREQEKRDDYFVELKRADKAETVYLRIADKYGVPR